MERGTRQIRDLLDRGEPRKAAAAAREAALAGALPEGLLEALVAGLAAAGEAGEAAGVLEALDPFARKSPPRVYALMAFLAALRRDAPGASRAVAEGLRHHPEDPGLLCDWGTLQWEGGARREALEAWERAFRLLPGWPRIDYLVAVATLGEPLADPARGESGHLRITPLYLPASGHAAEQEWYEGQLTQSGEDWVLALAEGGRDPAILLAGVKVLAVTSDENGLYARRAEVVRAVRTGMSNVTLRFLEPIHRVQRRRHVRILAHRIASCSVQGSSGETVPLHVTSLSASGVSFLSPDEFRCGVRLAMSLVVDPEAARLPSAPAARGAQVGAVVLRLAADVVRCRRHEKQFSCSARFDISTRDQDTLARLIHLAQLNLRRIRADGR